MKQILSILLCCMLIALAGCNNNSGNSSVSEPAVEPSVSEPDSEPEVLPDDDDDEDTTVFTVDGDVTVKVELDNNRYSHSTTIGTTVTITNNGDNAIGYVVGSGSNIAPDALQYTLGNLAPMFRPEIMTSDYHTKTLKPGESHDFNLNFAPYVSVDEERREFGADHDGLDFFRNDDFTPAETGKVEGKLVFEYRILPDGTDEDNLLEGFDDLDPVIVELEFHTTIDDDGILDNDNDDADVEVDVDENDEDRVDADNDGETSEDDDND